VDITFNTKKLEKQLTNPSQTARTYGTNAKKILQRIADLSAASNLADMRFILAARCHELTGNRAGELAVDIIKNDRIVFIPNHYPPPLKEDGGLDWSLVTAITITFVGDYH
jgi:proteic killer suppression protein